MNQNQMRFVPVLTSEAGASLTLNNWQEIGIDTVSYHLESLLMKPGFSLLSMLPDLRRYCGWQGTIVLNALLPLANQEGVYQLRSSYDGSLVRVDSTQLFSLIERLQPDVVIIPQGLVGDRSLSWQSLQEKSINVFIPGNEIDQAPADIAWGCFWRYDKSKSFSDFRQQINRQADRPMYVAGDFNELQSRELVELGVSWLESDKPAQDAITGYVYCEQGSVAILDSEMAYQQKLIANNCACPTCTQKFTRAYLHHLLKQTPLLCQRFLIQHNVHYYLNQTAV